MQKARAILDRDFHIADIDPRLYGGFVEHLGRHIYSGIYEPGHAAADTFGFRADVLALVRELGMPIIRYPGGNFVSGYNWEDGIGPMESRPRRLDLAWKTVESNRFGLHEFMHWCDLARSRPMLAVNLGTRGADAARDLVEYCNHPSGTEWSDRRRRNGAQNPFGVKVWCLGNEMDGPWQIAAKPATEYGMLARETAKAMKWIDPSVEVVLCGSSNNTMKTFGSWELEALDQAFEHVDYLSLHHYFRNPDGDGPSYLAQPEAMHDFIRGAVAACDAVAAKKRQTRRMMLSFDEWNAWTHTKAADRETNPWREAPRLLEERYTLEDALVVGGMLTALMNNADRVRMACLAQVVNVLAPILAEPGGPCWAQTTFHPFRDASRFGRGTVLRAMVDSPKYSPDGLTDVPYLATAFVLSPDGESLSAFLVNRHADSEVEMSVDLRAFAPGGTYSGTVLTHPDPKAANTLEKPLTVVPTVLPKGRFAENRLVISLRPLSWTRLTLEWK